MKGRVNDSPYINDAGRKKIQEGDSRYQWYAESAAPRIANSGEQILDNEYLREFEAKIGKVSVIV
jgi:hypothetical protein